MKDETQYAARAPLYTLSLAPSMFPNNLFEKHTFVLFIKHMIGLDFSVLGDLICQ